MKPDLDKGSLPAAYVNAEIRRTGAALLVSHVTTLLRARSLTLRSLLWNDGQGAHGRRESHTFRISSGAASASLQVSDEDLIALTNCEAIAQTPIGAQVRDVLDELANSGLADETA